MKYIFLSDFCSDYYITGAIDMLNDNHTQ